MTENKSTERSERADRGDFQVRGGNRNRRFVSRPKFVNSAVTKALRSTIKTLS